LARNDERKVYKEYMIFLALCLLFVIMAFIFDKPADIFQGLGKVLTHRGLLTTDFMVVGGLGAAIINSVIACLYGLAVVYIMGLKPDGVVLMCLWMTAGWTYRGATVLSILPLTIGVWLYSRYKKAPFSDYVLAALLCHTIAPIVSMFYFSNPIMLHLGAQWPTAINILIGVFVGLFFGFILPVVLAAAPRIHNGFTLYNMGVAGGIIALFLASCFAGAGIAVPAESMWYVDRQAEITVFLYITFAALLLAGFLFGRASEASHFSNIKGIISLSGHAPNDFYSLFDYTTYINMGLLGIIGTTWSLAIGCELNGSTISGIFSMVAFGCLGKHIKNVLPLLTGATLCALVNAAELSSPTNALAILFSSCLAPIAGKFGFGWGMVAGFIHVFAVTHMGPLTNGFNLYNNGFCSGFVAFILVPVIMAINKRRKESSPERE